VNDRDAKPSGDHLEALSAYGIKAFLWSARDSAVAVLGSN